MARDPGSLWSPLPESGRQGTGVKDKFVVHSTGDRGSAAAIYKYFSRPDIVVESTFVIGLSPSDPTRQMLDSSEVADANLGANITAIPVETVGTKDDPFTEWQISELIRIGRWARKVHGIPPRLCPTATSAGYGWHVMFGAPGPWTPVAKDCPGKVRIKQLHDRVFPAIFQDDEDDMYTDDDRKRDDGIAVLLDWFIQPDDDPNTPVDESKPNSKGELTKRVRNVHGLAVAINNRDAAAVAAAIPADLAQQVVAALGAKLTKN